MKQLSKAEICERQFDSYCKITLKRLVKDKARKSLRIAEHELNFSSIPLVVETISGVNDCLANTLDEVDDEELLVALRSLSHIRKEIVEMAYIQERSDVEISQLLKIPQSTVRYNRIQAIRSLRKQLDKKRYD